MFGSANMATWAVALVSLGVAIVAMIFMSLLEHRFVSGRFTTGDSEGRDLTALGWVEIFGIGALYGVVFFLNTMSFTWGDWVAFFPLLLSTVPIVYICARWGRDGALVGVINTALSFLLIGGACMMMISSAKIMASAWSAPGQIITLIIVWAAVPISACWVLASQFYAAFDAYNAETIDANDEDDTDAAESSYSRALLCLLAGRTTIVLKVLSIILIVILVISSVSSMWAEANSIAAGGSNNRGVATEPVTAGNQYKQNWLTYQEVTQKYSWLAWNNFALQSDGDPDNNANFGPDRHHEGWTATDYFQDMKTFDESDVLILVAHVAAVDAARDTRMVGDYYDGNNHDWARTMNALIAKCLSNKVDFMHFAEVYLNMLKYEVRNVRVVHMDDINDQMYITPYTYSGVPEIVASETHQSGDVLIVTFKRKGGEENDVSVGFRIDCCYQPVGIIDIMDLPNTEVEIPPEYVPDGQTPTTPPGGDNPNPTTPTTGVKNPADDPANRGNADKGGGDNGTSDGDDEYQPDDPRDDVDQPADVEPNNPPVTPGHENEDIVDYENPVNYEPDPVTDRGPVDHQKPPTSSNGDGEFVPTD